jgi:hypothetical protein
MFLGEKCGRCVGLIALLSVCRLSNNVGSLTSHNPTGLHGVLGGIALLYPKIGVIELLYDVTCPEESDRKDVGCAFAMLPILSSSKIS